MNAKTTTGPATRRALAAFVKLHRAADSVARRLAPELDALGLTWSQFGALEALYHLGPMCQRDLGDKLLKSTGNITLVVDNLERRGLVRRERSREDRRYITVSLTDEGERAIAAAFPRHARAIESAMSVLSPEEQEELGRLCRKLGLGQAPGAGRAPTETEPETKEEAGK